MTQGTVKWFNDHRGYGFIQPDKVGNDVFVRIGAVERAGMHTLNPGQKVSYRLTVERKTGSFSAEDLCTA